MQRFASANNTRCHQIPPLTAPLSFLRDQGVPYARQRGMRFDRPCWIAACALVLGVAIAGGCAEPKAGLLVMAHGGDTGWYEDVDAAVAPLRSDRPTEVALGMAVTSTIRDAVQKLEARGVERVAVVRMFISGESFLEPTEYILGMRSNLPPTDHNLHAAAANPHASHGANGHAEHASGPHDAHAAAGHDGHAGHGGHRMEPPQRIAAKSEFLVSRAGVAESPLIDQILVDRVRSLSTDPASESVLILGHGPGDDAENERWLANMRRRAAGIAQLGRFREIRCETLREDWPDKRVAAESRIRQFVENGARDGGRVIVVPFRVAGFGPYKEVLDGLTYVADGRGFCPHPNMTRWIQETAQECLATRK